MPTHSIIIIVYSCTIILRGFITQCHTQCSPQTLCHMLTLFLAVIHDIIIIDIMREPGDKVWMGLPCSEIHDLLHIMAQYHDSPCMYLYDIIIDSLTLTFKFYSALSIATVFEFLIFGCILSYEWMKLLDFRSVELVTTNE